jgi:hypothetical protein
LGCALGLQKWQQICCSTGSSSIGSCSIGCCGGGGSVGVAAAGCTLTGGAAGCSLVGAGGVLRLCPRGLHYALPLRLALRPRGSRYALAAWALPLRLTLRARGLGCGGRGSGGGGGGSGSNGSECSPSRLALHAYRLGIHPCSLRYALAARLRPNTTIKQQSSGHKSCFSSAATYLPQR